ncbi:hypothetical protein CYMTET_55968 [Cymbomonas tetramitiformis]|uniref:Uncharacterized protein n=1 Tax=Cymbomonas tetramitiformis TaxID=36881 RepID=A0AAE0EN12_9CHLO|nr:hypothetical protein CYMTET_55968 [Cymbomonas tetramitiformis]
MLSTTCSGGGATCKLARMYYREEDGGLDVPPPPSPPPPAPEVCCFICEQDDGRGVHKCSHCGASYHNVCLVAKGIEEPNNCGRPECMAKRTVYPASQAEKDAPKLSNVGALLLEGALKQWPPPLEAATPPEVGEGHVEAPSGAEQPADAPAPTSTEVLAAGEPAPAEVVLAPPPITGSPAAGEPAPAEVVVEDAAITKGPAAGEPAPAEVVVAPPPITGSPAAGEPAPAEVVVAPPPITGSPAAGEPAPAEVVVEAPAAADWPGWAKATLEQRVAFYPRWVHHRDLPQLAPVVYVAGDGVHGKEGYTEKSKGRFERGSVVYHQGQVYKGAYIAGTILHVKDRGWFTICGGPIHGRYATPHLTHIFRMNRLNQGSTDTARGAAHFKTEEGSDIVYECARIFFPKLIKLHKHYGLENGVSLPPIVRQLTAKDLQGDNFSSPHYTQDDYVFVDALARWGGGANAEPQGGASAIAVPAEDEGEDLDTAGTPPSGRS